MDFTFSSKVDALREQLLAFMDEIVYPNEKTYTEQHEAGTNRWESPPVMTDMKRKAAQPIYGICSCPKVTRVTGSRTSNTLPCAKSWDARQSDPKCSTVHRRIPATWRYWCDMAPKPSRVNG